MIELEVRRSEHREDERLRRCKVYYHKDLHHVSQLQDSASTAESQFQGICRQQREREIVSDRILSRRQDNILFVCFYILMNLAEDVIVKRKMIKKRLIPLLLTQLNRMRVNILHVSIAFLHKISAVCENLGACRDMKIISKVANFVPCSSESITAMTIRLLYNLSFDHEVSFSYIMSKC